MFYRAASLGNRIATTIKNRFINIPLHLQKIAIFSSLGINIEMIIFRTSSRVTIKIGTYAFLLLSNLSDFQSLIRLVVSV